MKYLGVDFGLKRIGLAVSEGELASAWKVVEVRNLKDAILAISQIITAEGFEKIIVGMPEGGKMTKTIKGFINGLKKIGIESEAWDETLTSKNATKLMVDLNLSKKARQVNDSYSAMLILQDYLDSK